jgi:CRISPR type III-B/RAMP module RAMP protein Cmr6
MIIGLGGENVLETGITLHHTYGTPVIPGSALKGLAWHYCHQVWGSQESKFMEGGEYHTAIFGTTEDAGHFTFHDGMILPDTLTSSIHPDVMTPHHGEYYQNKDFPTDFDDPNPVTFLSVTGTFFIAVTCDIQDETGKEWEKLVFDLLSEALSTWGIGGKTSSGYGILELVSSSGKKTVPGKVPVTGQGNPLSPQQAHAHTPQAEINPYRSGMTVRVTRCEDIIRTKRGHETTQKIYQAEDGRFGIIEYGDSAIVGVGESTELIVVRYDAGDKKYFFAVPGTWVPR